VLARQPPVAFAAAHVGQEDQFDAGGPTSPSLSGRIDVVSPQAIVVSA
jgi:hypothetical protein